MEYFLTLSLNSLSLNKNIITNIGIENTIGCVLKDNTKFPLIKAKNALVIPHVKQGILKNLCIKHPVSKYHIPKVTAPTKQSNRIL